jgi:hypothetical protein
MAKKKNDTDGSIDVMDIDELAGLSVDSGPAVEVPTSVPTPAPPVMKIEPCVINVVIASNDSILTGYTATMSSVSVNFPPEIARKFRRLVAALQEEHATYIGSGGRVMHVDYGADAIKWLISQLPD